MGGTTSTTTTTSTLPSVQQLDTNFLLGNWFQAGNYYLPSPSQTMHDDSTDEVHCLFSTMSNFHLKKPKEHPSQIGFDMTVWEYTDSDKDMRADFPVDLDRVHVFANQLYVSTPDSKFNPGTMIAHVYGTEPGAVNKEFKVMKVSADKVPTMSYYEDLETHNGYAWAVLASKDLSEWSVLGRSSETYTQYQEEIEAAVGDIIGTEFSLTDMTEACAYMFDYIKLNNYPALPDEDDLSNDLSTGAADATDAADTTTAAKIIVNEQ